MFSDLDAKGLTQGVKAVCPTLDSSPITKRPALKNTTNQTNVLQVSSAFTRFPSENEKKCKSDSPVIDDSENETPPSASSSGGTIRRAVEPWKYVLREGPSGTQYECSDCQSTYKHKKSLNKHWKDKHPHLLNRTPHPIVPLSRSKSLMTAGSTPRRGRTSIKRPREDMLSPSHNKRTHASPTFASPHPKVGCSVAARSSLPPIPLIDKENPHLLPESKPAVHPLVHNNNDALDLSLTSSKETPLDLTISRGFPDRNSPPQRNLVDISNTNNLSDTSCLVRPQPLKLVTPIHSQNIYGQNYPPSIQNVYSISMDSYSNQSSSMMVQHQIPGQQFQCPPPTVLSMPTQALQIPQPVYHQNVIAQPIYHHQTIIPNQQSLQYNPAATYSLGDQSTNVISSVYHSDNVHNPSNIQMSSLNTSSNLDVSQEVVDSTRAVVGTTTNNNDNTTLSKCCYQCQQLFDNFDSLNQHFNSVHYNLILSTELKKVESWKTNIQLTNKELEEFKIIDDTQTIIYSCKLCEFKTNFGTEFQRHYHQRHKRDRFYSCCVCGQNYKWRWDLARHFHQSHASLPSNPYAKYLQTDHRPLQNSSSSKMAPTTTVAASSSTQNSTTTTTTTTTTNNNENENQNNSTPESQLPCPRCQYKARWPSELRSHMVNHSGHRAFGCQFCGYRAKWKWDVAKHLKRCREATKLISLPASNDYLVQFVVYHTPPPDDILHEFKEDDHHQYSSTKKTIFSTDLKRDSDRITVHREDDSPPILKKESLEVESHNNNPPTETASSTRWDDESNSNIDVVDSRCENPTPLPLADLSFENQSSNQSAIHSSECSVKNEMIKTESWVDNNESKHSVQSASSDCHSNQDDKSTLSSIKIKLKRCPFCDYMSGNARELQNHVRDHTFDNE